ncbi:hypothetical protein SARC_01765 [Sphaeroforma arctica JP610]|uniref:Uncharacterized protein n=1 Tax=Sphaeroforma arctica JP610 TaxID=667725 RepID=A0A0L0GCX9_9EUKA|nr:hypothetical protein SARC_01765 [Sphaeroforma arctica JP610]KNC86073.1 hypothetical protein SARC_01765 [Sphaeroforma arctica JP610]|eukprot:XP_014159975.1 hypothetical protein SARC_01765 [Sphaeroforma arctica JP610]
MAPLARRVVSFRGLFSLNKSKKIAESVVKDLGCTSNLPASLNTVEVATGPRLKSISEAPLVNCVDSNSQVSCEGEIEKLTSALKSTNPYTDNLTLSVVSALDIQDKEVDITDCLSDCIDTHSDSSGLISEVEMAEFAMQTTVSNCRNLGELQTGQRVIKCNTFPNKSDDVEDECAEPENTLKTSELSPRGYTVSDISDPEHHTLKWSRHIKPIDGQRRASSIHGRVASPIELLSPRSRRTTLMSSSDMNLHCIKSCNTSVKAVERNKWVGTVVQLLQDSESGDGSKRSRVSDPDNQINIKSKLDSEQAQYLQMEIASLYTLPAVTRSLSPAAGVPYKAATVRILRQASHNAVLDNQPRIWRENEHPGMKKRATSLRVAKHPIGSNVKEYTKIRSQPKPEKPRATIAGLKRQGSIPAADLSLNGFHRVHEKPSSIEHKIAVKRAARQTKFALQTTGEFNSLLDIRGSSFSGCDSSRTLRAHSYTPREMPSTVNKMQTPSNRKTYHGGNTYATLRSVPSLTAVTPEKSQFRKSPGDTRWLPARRAVFKPRVLLNTATTLHTTYGEEYDRTPCTVSTLTRTEFRELMAFKVNEMLVHCNSEQSISFASFLSARRPRKN